MRLKYLFSILITAFGVFVLSGKFLGLEAQAASLNNKQAVVKVEIRTKDGAFRGSGSGVIIDAEGRIITNHHVIELVKRFPDLYSIVICITERETEPPLCSATARVIESVEFSDLALIQIDKMNTVGFGLIDVDEYRLRVGSSHRYIKWAPIDKEQSDYGVNSSDRIEIIGYPRSGGETINITSGIVSGFAPLNFNGSSLRYQIKTDASLDPGNSGGGAFTMDGQLIGTPNSRQGQVGYIIAIPFINSLLRISLGQEYMSKPQSYIAPINPVQNGFLEMSSDCPEFSDYHDNVKKCQCRTGFFTVGRSCMVGVKYCDIIGKRYDSYTKSCTSTDPYKGTLPPDAPPPIVAPVVQVQTPQPEENTSSVAPGPSSTDQPTASALPQVGLYKPEKKDVSLTRRLSGRILLQAESRGEAWYINPVNLKRYYLQNGQAAYALMRTLGLGIKNTDLSRIPAVSTPAEMKTTASVCSTNKLAKQLGGRIVLQVEQRGEAWYVDPVKCRRIYMENGAAAYAIMRYLGLGITNTDIEKVESAVE